MNFRVKYGLFTQEFHIEKKHKWKLVRYIERLLRPNNRPIPYVQTSSVRWHLCLSFDFCVIISTLLYQHNYLRDICLPKLRVKTLGITVYTSTQKFGTHVQHYEHKDYLSNHIKSGGQIVHPPTSRGCNSLSKFPSEHPGEKMSQVTWMSLELLTMDRMCMWAGYV